MDYSGSLTILLWLTAWGVGAMGFLHTRRFGQKWVTVVLRAVFAVMLTFAVWACVTYALWLTGVPLKIGTIERDIMGDQWWLGPLCLIWAGLAYIEIRRESK